MGLQETPELILLDQLRDLARKLDAAGKGEKGPLKDGWCATYGWSPQRLHRALNRIGYASGRKRRADAGTSKVSEEVILDLGAALGLGFRKNGKATMEIPNARSLLASNGREIGVSNSTLRRQLRRRHLDARSQQQATPHVQMRSLHPNHVHLVDPSLCLLYYSPDGRQHMIRDDEAYKNKPEFIERIGDLKCWRYVLVDHYSHSIVVRYYQAKGETAENLYDFLLYSWRKIEGRPFHGVPSLLVWDKGSANTSSAIKRALHLLDVDTYDHMAGNPRAKGSVEQANNLVEKLFESRLKYEPVASVEALNQAAENWCRAYNADRIPEYDARLKRRGMERGLPRYEIWQRISQDQLRILPDIDVCRYLLSAEPKPRTVRPDLTVTFVHPVAKRSLTYDLRGLDGVVKGMSVRVSPLVMGSACQVIVELQDYKGDTTEHVLSPVDFDAMGMRLDAPIYGQQFERAPDTQAETARKAADAAAFPGLTQAEIDKAKAKNAIPFGGLDAHTHLGEVYVPDYLDKRGTELTVPDRTQVEIRPLGGLEARRILANRLGRNLTTEEAAWIRDSYPAGVPETDLPALTARLAGTDQAQRPGLRAVK